MLYKNQFYKYCTRHISGYLTVLAMCTMAFADNGNGVVVTARSSDDCQVTPVIHVLQYPGCVPKPIPSFACTGRCSSYLQVKQKISVNYKQNIISV